MKSEVFIQGDDLWSLHYGYDLDHVLTGTKVIFSYLCLPGAGCQIRIGIYYGVYDATYPKSYELASKLRLNAPRRTIYLAWHQSGCPGPSQLKDTFKGGQHLSAVSAVPITCPCCSFFFLFLVLLQGLAHQPVGILEMKSLNLMLTLEFMWESMITLVLQNCISHQSPQLHFWRHKDMT